MKHHIFFDWIIVCCMWFFALVGLGLIAKFAWRLVEFGWRML